MTSLTLISMLVVIYGAFSKKGFARAVAIGGITPAGAALVAGTVAVPTFYFVALGALVALASSSGTDEPVELAGKVPTGIPGLTVFFGWCTFITVMAPFLFDGLRTHVPSIPVNVLTAGSLTSSNIAQVAYLFLGIAVVLLLARTRGAGPPLLGLTLGGTTLLCLWAYLGTLGVPFPKGWFDNSPTFKYIQTEVGGAERFRGIFSEPAGLALSCVATSAYMGARSLRTAGATRVGCIAVALVAIYLGVVSTSATFLVGGLAVLAVGITAYGLGFLARKFSLNASVIMLSPILVLLAVVALPILGSFVQAAIDAKVSSSSFDDRGSLDDYSYAAFRESMGLGVGLGSNRGSSFFASLLAATGLFGVVLLALSITSLVRNAWSVVRYRPVIWTLVAVLSVKVVSGPDLSDTSGILWICLGLLANAAMFGREANERDLGRRGRRKVART